MKSRLPWWAHFVQFIIIGLALYTLVASFQLTQRLSSAVNSEFYRCDPGLWSKAAWQQFWIPMPRAMGFSSATFLLTYISWRRYSQNDNIQGALLVASMTGLLIIICYCLGAGYGVSQLLQLPMRSHSSSAMCN